MANFTFEARLKFGAGARPRKFGGSRERFPMSSEANLSEIGTLGDKRVVSPSLCIPPNFAVIPSLLASSPAALLGPYLD
jgi:hypothetical protein